MKIANNPPPLNKKVKYIILPVDHRAVTALAVKVAVRFSNKFDRLIVMALAYGALPPALGWGVGSCGRALQSMAGVSGQGPKLRGPPQRASCHHKRPRSHTTC